MLLNKLEIHKKIKKMVKIPITALPRQADIHAIVAKKRVFRKIPIHFGSQKKSKTTEKPVNTSEKTYSPKPGPITVQTFHELKDKIRAKKTVLTPTENPSPPKKELIIASDDTLFRLVDGGTINSLLELRSAVEKMSNQQFQFHCNPEKNDFYLWVKDTLKDEKCANDIQHIRTQKLFAEIVNDNLLGYHLD